MLQPLGVPVEDVREQVAGDSEEVGVEAYIEEEDEVVMDCKETAEDLDEDEVPPATVIEELEDKAWNLGDVEQLSEMRLHLRQQ